MASGPNADLSIAALFIDLDHFKAVNDRLGHAAGDELLILVAHQLRSIVREGDVVGRLGGDEFVVLLDDVATHETAHVLAGRILDALSRSFIVSGQSVTIGASIGIVVRTTVEPHSTHCWRVPIQRCTSQSHEAAPAW